jgi:multidrug efflux pump subunit AcrB
MRTLDNNNNSTCSIFFDWDKNIKIADRECSIRYQEELEKVKNQLATKNQEKMYVKITCYISHITSIQIRLPDDNSSKMRN